jgi:hypothetical protein
MLKEQYPPTSEASAPQDLIDRLYSEPDVDDTLLPDLPSHEYERGDIVLLPNKQLAVVLDVNPVEGDRIRIAVMGTYGGWTRYWTNAANVEPTAYVVEWMKAEAATKAAEAAYTAA